jgi:ParB family chromosome partitioning protein
MTTQQRRLGRGLEALLGRPAGESEGYGSAAPPEARLSSSDAGEAIVQLPVSQIESNPFQPRQDFDEAALSELAASLAEHGLLQPLVVRRHGERYQLVAGERRWRAAMKAGWAAVPAQVREADDRQMAELAIVENLQRRDLNALEKATSFQQYLERYGCTQADLASRLKVDRSTIANLIRLLELPGEVQLSLRSGALSPGHARALLPLGDEQQQVLLSARICKESLSVRAVEDLVQDMIRESDDDSTGNGDSGQPAVLKAKTRKSKSRSGHLAQLEQEFRASLGAKVAIRVSPQGRGRIVISFASHDDFERLRDILCGPAENAA